MQGAVGERTVQRSVGSVDLVVQHLLIHLPCRLRPRRLPDSAYNRRFLDKCEYRCRSRGSGVVVTVRERSCVGGCDCRRRATASCSASYGDPCGVASCDGYGGVRGTGACGPGRPRTIQADHRAGRVDAAGGELGAGDGVGVARAWDGVRTFTRVCVCVCGSSVPGAASVGGLLWQCHTRANGSSFSTTQHGRSRTAKDAWGRRRAY